MTSIHYSRKRKVGSDSITHLADMTHRHRVFKVLTVLLECNVEAHCAQLITEYMCPPNRARVFRGHSWNTWTVPDGLHQKTVWRLELN